MSAQKILSENVSLTPFPNASYLTFRLWTGMNDKQFELLQSCLSSVVSDSDEQVLDSNVSIRFEINNER